ncbi:MAG: citramalate synthase [Spirochaetaceae bacterium]|nr:citramalate synthase [Spirochaetaceae bacterium]
MAEARKITVLDSTLRDGAQGEGISFSVQDKIHIVQTLDALGIDLIEAGNPDSNPKDLEFFQLAQKLELKHSKLAAFGSTRRKDMKPQEDRQLQSLLAAETENVVVFGKSWDFQVTDILKTSLEDNLAMIEETVQFLAAAGRTVHFDAEHFFAGWNGNKEYALKTLEAAALGGASSITLCDTKGGSMPLEILSITKEVVAFVRDFCRRNSLPQIQIGIHTHNDCGLAVANTLMAVEGGVSLVQGVLLGFGERTGNANLSTVIADLELKSGMKCLPEGKIAELTPTVRRIAEIANISLDNGMPYVGTNAFAHKAGMHIDAVTKNPASYEHVPPESVGNERVFLMSEVAGRSLIIEKIHKFDANITKSSPVVTEIVNKVKQLEHDGYKFEGADGSFELLVRKIIGKYQPFFKLHYYKTMGEQSLYNGAACSFAQLKIEVDNQIEITAGEGSGPVHALDTALRKALERFYPNVSAIRLTDYKVRVLDSQSATASKVRVLIESSDSTEDWTTVGVSTDIIEASWLALVDSIEYKLIKDFEKKYKKFL